VKINTTKLSRKFIAIGDKNDNLQPKAEINIFIHPCYVKIGSSIMIRIAIMGFSWTVFSWKTLIKIMDSSL
jgi:hypothetical protein